MEPDSVATGSGGRRQSHAKDYKKLGFTNITNPVDDFSQIPPGALALDNMVYFACIYGENYTKVINMLCIM